MNDELNETISNRDTIIKTVTKYKTVNKTVTLTDTVIKGGDTVFIPIYTSVWDNEWSSGNVKATQDTTIVDFEVYNDFRFEHITKGGIFRKRTEIINVINQNPYVTDHSVKSYKFKPKQKLFSVGIQGGLGITPVGVQPYLGVGVQVNLR